jgi:hypothetical protein
MDDKRRKQRLEAFSDLSKELDHATKTYLLQKITISFDSDNPTKAPIEGFIDGITEGGLLALIRQLVDEHEVTSFIGICGVLNHYYKEDSAKLQKIKDYKNAWNDKIVGHNSQLGIDLEGETLLNHDLVKLLSYTGRLHTDIDKKEYQQMLSLKKSGYTPLLQFQLSGMIEGAAILVRSLKIEFIDSILNDTDS